MHLILSAVLYALTGITASGATAAQPAVQPVERLQVTVELSSAATSTLDAWWQQQQSRIGPPAPHLWMVWRLQQLPEGIGGPLVSGCEKLLHDQPAPVIDLPGIGSGLWRMTATVQTDPADNSQIVLTGWRCVEIKSGVVQTTAQLRLQPALPLVIRLTLDQPPNPKEPALVGLCLFDDHGLVDLKIVEMAKQNVTLAYPIAPEGRLRIVAVVLSDQPPTRRAVRIEVVGRNHNLIILPLIRAPADPVVAYPATLASSRAAGRYFSGKLIS